MTDNHGLREDLLANAFEATIMGPDAFVEAQEARGQEKLAASELLPAEGDWEALEALGFVKGEPVEGDPLFVHATIPEGWYKERTEHHLYTVIKDQRGIERVSVGYKAAFYDRWARISVVNIGYKVASGIIYGDEPVALPDYWDLLTAGEQIDARNALLSDQKRDEEFIEKYGDKEGRYAAYLDRIKKGLELMGYGNG